MKTCFTFLLSVFLFSQVAFGDTTCVRFAGVGDAVYERPQLANQISTTHFIIHWQSPTTQTYAQNAANYAEYANEEQKIPTDYGLLQNYPNPFNPSTTIEYKLPLDELVTIKVYDMLGNEVATLVNEEKVAGKYDVNFDASRLANGIYLYRIKVNDFYSTKKMVFLK